MFYNVCVFMICHFSSMSQSKDKNFVSLYSKIEIKTQVITAIVSCSVVLLWNVDIFFILVNVGYEVGL